MTHIIIPNAKRTHEGNTKEIEHELDSKREKLRVTFKYPTCKLCNHEVDSFKMERFKRDGFDYLALIVRCHGKDHYKEILEYGPILEKCDTFFDDIRMVPNTHQSFLVS